MNNTEKFLIDVLRCFATDTKTKLNTDGVDKEELFALSKKQSVTGIVSYILERYDIFSGDEIRAKFAREYDYTIMQMLSRESSAQKLCDKFTEMGIPHIMFKGTTISEVYPVKVLRAYGDVDIIVHKEHIPAIREYMTGEGFEYSLTDEGVVSVFRRGREKYEIHTSLNEPIAKSSAFFSDLWSNAELQHGQTYSFNHNFHLCYLICHLEKHVYGSGSGVKMYLDIALYLRKYPDSIDMDYVRESLSSCGLGQFFETVLYMCNRWFGLELPSWVKPLEEELYEQMCEFIFSGGVFGVQGKKDIMSDDLRREMASGRKFAKFRFILSRIFPSAHELCRMFPQFQGKPLLVPCAWFCHVFKVISKGKLSNVKAIIKTDAEQAQDKKEFLDRIGSRR